MARIDFVPEDYTQRRQWRRANFLYMGLVSVMLLVFLVTFMSIKIRQKSLNAEEAAVDVKMAAAQQSIAQLETLQVQRQEMMKKALLTAELIEPVPRSIVLALLTNTIPDGLSLSEITLKQRKLSTAEKKRYKSKYEAIKSAGTQECSEEADSVNIVEISGFAASDIAVADYISNLTHSVLLEEVGLVQSKKYDSEKGVYREFKLSAFIKTNVQLTAEDIENISNYDFNNSTVTDNK